MGAQTSSQADGNMHREEQLQCGILYHRLAGPCAKFLERPLDVFRVEWSFRPPSCQRQVQKNDQLVRLTHLLNTVAGIDEVSTPDSPPVLDLCRAVMDFRSMSRSLRECDPGQEVRSSPKQGSTTLMSALPAAGRPSVSHGVRCSEDDTLRHRWTSIPKLQ